MGLFRKKAKPAVLPENAGGMVITRSIYDGTAKLKWLFREESIDPQDTGWRAISDTDTQEYLDDPANSMVVDFNTLVNIEPAVLLVYDMPAGTDLEFCTENGRRYFIDAQTGKKVP